MMIVALSLHPPFPSQNVTTVFPTDAAVGKVIVCSAVFVQSITFPSAVL
jgi:hypothetical protein